MSMNDASTMAALAAEQAAEDHANDLLILNSETDNINDDDDNAQQDDDNALVVENEDPFSLAMDDLEGRVVAAIDDIKMHPGVRMDSSPGAPNLHQELAILLRPVLEVAAHTAPSVARTYHADLEASMETAYERIISDLVLPVMLEMAQSDTIPAKRGASLEFFKTLWKEAHKAGSWLDDTVIGMNAGPYGPGVTHGSSSAQQQRQQPHLAPAVQAVWRRRQQKRLQREGEILRYWIEAAVACLVAGVFTAEQAAASMYSRGIIAASAALRPALHHISRRIKDADDRGAARLYAPVMKMVEGVLQKLLVNNNNNNNNSSSSNSSYEAVQAACIKFLEIVVLCCSRKPQDDSSRRRGYSTAEGFSLDDLPTGHPTITQEALESIAEYAFTTLRGMTLMGGQVKIDINLLSDMMLSGGGTPSEQVVSILKPAALAFLELESSVQKSQDEDGEDALDFALDRSNVEFDFFLSQKSYALTINAMSALATNRPIFFRESATCLARRAVRPPLYTEEGPLTKTAVLVIASQLKASCLTLLRNASSVTSGASGILHKALKALDMELQADKALKMANQAHSLTKATRAVRNQAKMHYEWEASSEVVDRTTKRQRETDDALAKMRAAKKARGLGHGIQLPSNMSDAVDLVLLNLTHLPAKPAVVQQSVVTRKGPEVTLDFVIDAIMTNGASLHQEEGLWYERDGGNAWDVDPNSSAGFQLGFKMIETLDLVKENNRSSGDKSDETIRQRRQQFQDQCNVAASDAVSRILRTASNSRNKSFKNLSNQLAARLAFTSKGVPPGNQYNASHAMAKESVGACANRLLKTSSSLEESVRSLETFVDEYPLAASSLALMATAKAEAEDPTADPKESSLSEAILNEAMMQSAVNTVGVDGTRDPEQSELYDQSLDVFVASVVHAGDLANEKSSDSDRKKAALRAMMTLRNDIPSLPRLTRNSLMLISSMCDVEDIVKKAAESSRITSQEAIAASASAHAAKAAAEKRATAALLVLRDVAFQRDSFETRKCAVECAVALASGRLPTSGSYEDSVHEKALKLVVNVLFAKNGTMAELVTDFAISDLEFAAEYAIERHADIQKANEEADQKDDDRNRKPFSPRSDLEKQIMSRMRKAAVLAMALGVRRPEIIRILFSISCREKADVLSKAVRANMSILAKPAAAKYGAAAIALRIADSTGSTEVPMLLAFLENLVLKKGGAEQDVIDACFKIQETKSGKDGKKDPRFLIPVVSTMKRHDLVMQLPDFVMAEDNIFLAGLVHMGDRVGRQALLFREEIDGDNPSLHGMTLCEQLVFLHKLDFKAAGIPQTRYLQAIKLCLEDDEVFNDRVLMSALDHMSGVFIQNSETLPLTFMRTTILVCVKHESLHSWVCHVLLPRLVEGEIWNDARQFEGWMRCAHMLEQSGDPNVNIADVIAKLPNQQLMQYRTKWAQ